MFAALAAPEAAPGQREVDARYIRGTSQIDAAAAWLAHRGRGWLSRQGSAWRASNPWADNAAACELDVVGLTCTPWDLIGKGARL